MICHNTHTHIHIHTYTYKYKTTTMWASTLTFIFGTKLRQKMEEQIQAKTCTVEEYLRMSLNFFFMNIRRSEMERNRSLKRTWRHDKSLLKPRTEISTMLLLLLETWFGFLLLPKNYRDNGPFSFEHLLLPWVIVVKAPRFMCR